MIKQNIYTKTELKILREIINRANKREQIYILKRENDVYITFNNSCEIKVCSIEKFPYNMNSEFFEKPQYDPLEKTLSVKRSEEIPVYFSTPDKNNVCEILPNIAGVDEIGIDKKIVSLLGKICKFKLFATENNLFYSIYNEKDEFIGIIAPSLFVCFADRYKKLKKEAKKLFEYSKKEKTA